MSERHRAGYMPWDRTGNRILVQSELGKNKPSNYSLPEENFVYGRTTAIDPEKGNEVMYSWKEQESSENKNLNKVKDIIAINKNALRNHATTSASNYQFRKTQTVYKPFKEGSKNIKIMLPEENFTYGRPGDLEDPIKLVIANDYGETDKFLRHTNYQIQTSRSQPKNKKLSCHMTKNHSLVKEAQAKRMALFNWARRGEIKTQWKLPKFTNALPKVDHRRTASNQFQDLDQVSRKSMAGNSAPRTEGISVTEQ